MTLQDRLAQELKSAMLAREKERLGTLRLLKSALDYAQIDKKVENLPDADVIAIVQKEVKKRRDSAHQFRAGNRPELAEKEEQEIKVLATFLPHPLSTSELEEIVRNTIKELAATSRKEMGAVMKAVQGKVAGRADGKTVSDMISRALS